MQLFDMLLDGLLEKGWARGAEMEACKSEYQSFVQAKRQLERLQLGAARRRERPDLLLFTGWLPCAAPFL